MHYYFISLCLCFIPEGTQNIFLSNKYETEYNLEKCEKNLTLVATVFLSIQLKANKAWMRKPSVQKTTVLDQPDENQSLRQCCKTTKVHDAEARANVTEINQTCWWPCLETHTLLIFPSSVSFHCTIKMRKYWDCGMGKTAETVGDYQIACIGRHFGGGLETQKTKSYLKHYLHLLLTKTFGHHIQWLPHLN